MAAVLSCGLAALLIAGLAILTQSAPRRSGTNLTTEIGDGVGLQAGQTLCEPGEVVPSDTGAIRLRARALGGFGPALAVAILGPAGRTAGSLPAGWRTGQISIPLQRTLRRDGGGTVCLKNDGPGRALFGGSVPDGPFVVLIDGRPLGGRLRIEYMRPGSESWLGLVPEISRRFAIAKAGAIRHWAFYAAIVLALLAVALAVRTVALGGRAAGERNGKMHTAASEGP